VAPGWLEALRASLDDSDVAICRIDTKKLNAYSWVSRIDLNDEDTKGELETLEDHRAPYPPNLIMVRGWGFAIRRDFHDAIHGFDETLMAGEDLDYGFRAQIAGAKPAFAYDALLYYRFRPQFKAMIKQWRNYGKYTVLMRKKYHPKESGFGFGRSWAIYFLGWLKLFLWLLKTRSKEEFALVMRNSAFRLGTLEGCLQYGLNPHE
jgi:GT2 family glycosyltransferase